MPRNIVDEQAESVRLSITDADIDDLINEAIKVVCQYDRASASLIQRRLSIGYARAARIIDQLEAMRVLSSSDGSSAPRKVLIQNPDEVKGIKHEEKKVYEEPELKYKSPKLSIIQKPKQNPWKYSLHDALNNKSFKNAKGFSFPVGFTDDKKLVIDDVENIKHLIIGGYSLSQKEVMMDTILTSLILRVSPNHLKLILVDPARYLNFYNNLPHLLAPVINDPDKSISAFRWVLAEIDRRLKIFTESGVRDLNGYNNKTKYGLPKILVMINQIEDCLLYSPVEVEDAIARILMLAPRCGVHIIFTANHLTGKIIPPSIQSEIPCRLFFKFASYYEAGTKKVTEVEKLKLGEVIYTADGGISKLNAIFTSDENVKDVVAAVIKSSKP